MRRAGPGDLAAFTSAGMLPFLDILFATVAIFVVVMLVQRVVRVEALPYRVDVVMVCPDGRTARVFVAPDAPPLEVAVEREPLVRTIAGLPYALELNALVAVGRGCLDRLPLFEEIRVQLETSRELGGSQRLVRLVTIPAEPPDEVVDELLGAWRKRNDGRPARR